VQEVQFWGKKTNLLTRAISKTIC